MNVNHFFLVSRIANIGNVRVWKNLKAFNKFARNVDMFFFAY